MKNWIGLVLGVLLTIGLAKLGSVHRAEAKLVSGDGIARSEGVVKVRGQIQWLKPSEAGGYTVALLTEDGTPVQAYLGPDVDAPRLKTRAWILAEGRTSDGLFLVSVIRLENRLTRDITYRTRESSDEYTYAQVGSQVLKFPKTRGRVVRVATYGSRPVVEGDDSNDDDPEP